jgi:hypothetical protein
MWVLVFVKLLFPEPGFYDVDAQLYGQYEQIDDCFKARELLIIDMGSVDGYPPVDTQVVCIRTNEKWSNSGN